MRAVFAVAALALACAAIGARADEFDEDLFEEEVPEDIVAEDAELDADFAGPAPVSQPDPEAKEAAAAADAATTPIPSRGVLSQTQGWDILALVGVVLYVATYFVGSSVNYSIADAWFRKFGGPGKLIPNSFDRTKLCADDGSPFNKDTANSYRFFASGRAGTRGLVVSLDLLPRQDLFSWALAALSGDEDTITFEIFMEPASMAPFVLAVAPRRRRRRVHKGSTDLAVFADLVDPRRAPAALGDLCVLADTPEAVACIHDTVARTFASHCPPLPTRRYKGDSSRDDDDDAPADAHKPSRRSAARAAADRKREAEAEAVERADEPLFRLLHVTDRVPAYDRGVELLSNAAVRCMFKLPSASGMDGLEDLMAAAIKLADRVSRTRLSSEVVARNKKLRERLDEVRAEEEEGEAPMTEAEKNALKKQDQLERLKRTNRSEYERQKKKLIEKKMRKMGKKRK